MWLVPQINLQLFDKWAIDFVGPISPPGKRTNTCYIITTMDYLTKWDKDIPIKDCTTATTDNFLFENVVRRFGYPRIILSDQGTHFVNKMIDEITAEF